ncbi:MAG: MEDS domain-containing protein [Methanosarcina sp.]
MSKGEIRESGINIVGDINWGTHFCQLYYTKEELMEVLIPYFRAGLENNEFCVLITLNSVAIEKALRGAISDLDVYLQKGQLEIIPYNDWYLKEGFFEPRAVLNNWAEKLDMVSKEDYEGLRFSEDIFSFGEYRDDFVVYEKEMDRITRNHPIIALCTYSLKGYSATEIIGIIASHQFALFKEGTKLAQIKKFD